MWSTLGRVSARALNLLSRVAAATEDAVACDGPGRPTGPRDPRCHDVASGDQRLDPSASFRDAVQIQKPVRRVEDTLGWFPGREARPG
jgi:hypothetical protein